MIQTPETILMALLNDPKSLRFIKDETLKNKFKAYAELLTALKLVLTTDFPSKNSSHASDEKPFNWYETYSSGPFALLRIPKEEQTYQLARMVKRLDARNQIFSSYFEFEILEAIEKKKFKSIMD